MCYINGKPYKVLAIHCSNTCAHPDLDRPKQRGAPQFPASPSCQSPHLGDSWETSMSLSDIKIY